MSDHDLIPASDDPIAARRVALVVLGQTLRRGRALDEALAASAAFAALAVRDRAFVRLLLGTTLRHLGEIDALLGRLIERPLAPQDAAATDALRLGVTQRLWLGTPPHAAVDTSVALVVDAGLPHMRGLVNAVLRRVGRDGTTLLADADAIRLNVPAWLWQSWVEAYGEETARAIAAAHLHEAPLDLTPRDDASAWAEKLAAELLPGGTLRRAAGGNVAELPGFADGAWWVQDAAATLPVHLLGAVAGRRVFDLCAAPGGKTLQLATGGAEVTAVDISAPRLARLHENLARCRLTAEVVQADVAKWQPERPADAIVLDAPCSATGTIRRHPDIAWLKTADDVARLTRTQDRLLQAAANMLRSGGVLVYAVCSLQPEEGPVRVAQALAADSRLQRRPVTADELPGLTEALTAEGDVRTLPSMWAERGGVDGFYIARLVCT